MPYAGARWNGAKLGKSGGVIEWSYTESRYPTDDYLFSNPGTDFRSAIEKAFLAWEKVANIDFRRIADGEDNDIRIGLAPLDGRDGGTLGECSRRTSSLNGAPYEISSAEVAMDRDEAWVSSKGKVTESDSGASFLAVAMHEIGHALGLDHEDKVSSIMATFSDPDITSLQAADIKLIRQIYGGRYTGGSKRDTITGLSTDDVLSGKGGNDRLDGGRGNDVLTGGGGQDSFVFSSGLSGWANVDRVTDFNHNDDTIRLENDIFKDLAQGRLAASRFKAVTDAVKDAAIDASDRILYDRQDGDLYFDRDGSRGTYKPVKFADVTSKALVDNTDFIVI